MQNSVWCFLNFTQTLMRCVKMCENFISIISGPVSLELSTLSQRYQTTNEREWFLESLQLFRNKSTHLLAEVVNRIHQLASMATHEYLLILHEIFSRNWMDSRARIIIHYSHYCIEAKWVSWVLAGVYQWNILSLY